MKISRPWLQKFFDAELPNAQQLADALTFHAFEIESVAHDVLDVKVTPNRGHDCLSHRGIAKELSAILNIPMTRDELAEPPELLPTTNSVSVDIKEKDLCPRYIVCHIRGVKVGPSPDWLREHLESVGQKSINNVVDATNFVMFNLGQPLHAFDAGQLSDREGKYAIAVRKAKEGERMVALDGKYYTLSNTMLVIADGHTDLPIGIAGVKGGAPAAITERTENIVIESANFDGVSVRRTAQALKLRTDASSRFEQVISPELAAYGIRSVVEGILGLAGGEVAGYVDEYPHKRARRSVSVSLVKINKVLGTQLRVEDVEDAFTRLRFAYAREGEQFAVFVPFERLDLTIPEDLVEEVARIVGYDKVPAAELSAFPKKPEVNGSFYSAEQAREELISKGYSEVYTSVFADKGDRVVANKVDGVRPYLRATLIDGLRDSYERNIRMKELLGLKYIRLFEIGTVWQKENEVTTLGIADENGVREEPLDFARGKPHAGYENLPTSPAERYKPFSRYPFIVRDIAMWVPQNNQSFTEVVNIFGEYSQGLLQHVDLFDQFQKDNRVSYAFHLVFQSFDRTLTDLEVNAIMLNISKAVGAKGFEVR
ncbi:MAG TPA: phenylalanine--tRNA ligase subunit beta [Candidatus Paceibacterota bacterium]|jgi:phenylalanyl-tRNA synthetase beta chain|nr:phenylalanine--tRNA ligase subunit beta [Candidatus Paceibacterota bacterium]